MRKLTSFELLANIVFLEHCSSAQSVRVSIDGKQYTNFCSNDYLGLCNHQVLKDAAKNAVTNYGVGAGAAQLLSGRHEIHDELERSLAEYTGYEAALLFSSGYLANIGLITALMSRHDLAHQDRLNHASLIDAIKLSGARSKRYRHADTESLIQALSNSQDCTQWIVTDSVFSMDGDLAPLNVLSEAAQAHSAHLLVDDAHGIGVLAKGRGARAHFNLSTEQLPIVMVTFGKALGTQGAAVLGSRQLREFLIQCSRTYIFDTAPPPAIAAATLAALNLIRTQPNINRRLNDNIKYFRKLCEQSAVTLSESTSPIQPIVLGDAERAVKAAAFLRQQGIYLRAVRPPTVPINTARLRICISATHEQEDIHHLVSSLSQFLNNERP